MSAGLALPDERPRADAAGTSWASITCLSLLTFLLVGLGSCRSAAHPIAEDLAITEASRPGDNSVRPVAGPPAFSANGAARPRPADGRPAYTAVLAAACSSRLTSSSSGAGARRPGHWRLLVVVDGHSGRLAVGSDLPKAIALLQGGTALAPFSPRLGGFLDP